MKRILILGGGVGGTLTANLSIKKLRRRVAAGEVTITVVDQTGQHTYQPGFMYIAMGGERAERLQRPERGLLDKRVALVVGEVGKDRRVRRRPCTSTDGEPVGYDYLVLATGSRIVPEEIEHFDTAGPPLLHRGGGTRAAQGARRLRWRPDRHRHRRHALQVPARAARGRLPDRGRAPPARAARHVASSTSARRSGARSRSRRVSEMATPILERKGIELHTFFNVETIDPDRHVVAEPRGRGAPVRPAHPRPAAQGPAVPHRLRARPRAGRLAADRPRDTPGGRPRRTSSRSATRPTCRCRRQVRRPISRRPSSPSGSWRRSRGARSITGGATTSARSCASSRSATARARCSSSTTSIHPGRRSRTSSGTSARSCSTRRTGIPSRRDASRNIRAASRTATLRPVRR